MKVKDQVQKMNSLMEKGAKAESFDEFYDENAVRQENDDPPMKREEAKEQMTKMMENIKSASYKVISSLAGENISMTQWEIAFKMKNGKKFILNEVAVQKWRNGKIIHERYYHKDIKF